MTAFALQQGTAVFYKTSRVITAIFEGAPTHIAQRHSNTVVRGILICGLPCSPPLHYFNCFYVFISLTAPYAGGIFKFRLDKNPNCKKILYMCVPGQVF